MTCFENLSNEIFHELFEYFDHIHRYEIFYHLNKRFQNLFLHSTYRIKLELSSLSKSLFESYYQKIIIPYQHQIQSLSLSNPFIIDFFLSSNRLIPQFIRLQAFIIKNIESTSLENLLNDLLLLPNLSTLIIICKQHYIPNRNNLYQQIFRLPRLTYCKLSLNISKFFEYVNREGSDLISPSSNRSNITHLILQDTIVLHEFPALLSHVPQLRHLSINRLCTSSYINPNIGSIPSKQLTHVSLDLGNVYFNEFELLLKTFLHQVQVLHISTPSDQTYSIANRWESLIPVYMPSLRIFSIDHRLYTNRNDAEIYMNLIDQFRSSFWIERQWFFACHMNVMGVSSEIYFYSIDPYRCRQFKLDLELIKTTLPPNKNIKMNSIRSLELGDENCTVHWTNYFPNVTQLTLKEHLFEEKKYISPFILRRMFSLEQITELNICLYDRYFKDFIVLLACLTNLQKLNLGRRRFEKNADLLESHEIAHVLSTKNKIECVKIEGQFALEDMKLLVDLFPQLQHLTICTSQGCFVEIIQHLLSKTNEKSIHLNSIYLMSADRTLSKKIIAQLQSENLRPVHFVAENPDSIRLWR